MSRRSRPTSVWGPYNSLVYPRRWLAFMKCGNGIIGDMCVHMFDLVGWRLDLGWWTKIYTTGGIDVDKASKAGPGRFDTTATNWGKPV